MAAALEAAALERGGGDGCYHDPWRATKSTLVSTPGGMATHSFWLDIDP